jgi:glycine/D-amino acid oxidase-like deaminating enzyme
MNENSNRAPDVALIGGGIIGSSIALRLSNAGYTQPHHYSRPRRMAEPDVRHRPFPDGILLAPSTARVISELVLTGKSSTAIEDYRPGRFGS